MKHLDLSVPAHQRAQELHEFFRANCVANPNPNDCTYVLPVEVFEEYAGISVRKHPLFFRPEIFGSGSDFNVYGNFRYLTISGLFKAVTVLATQNIIERRGNHDKDQSA